MVRKKRSCLGSQLRKLKANNLCNGQPEELGLGLDLWFYSGLRFGLLGLLLDGGK